MQHLGEQDVAGAAYLVQSASLNTHAGYTTTPGEGVNRPCCYLRYYLLSDETTGPAMRDDPTRLLLVKSIAKYYNLAADPATVENFKAATARNSLRAQVDKTTFYKRVGPTAPTLRMCKTFGKVDRQAADDRGIVAALIGVARKLPQQ